MHCIIVIFCRTMKTVRLQYTKVHRHRWWYQWPAQKSKSGGVGGQRGERFFPSPVEDGGSSGSINQSSGALTYPLTSHRCTRSQFKKARRWKPRWRCEWGFKFLAPGWSNFSGKLGRYGNVSHIRLVLLFCYSMRILHCWWFDCVMTKIMPESF